MSRLLSDRSDCDASSCDHLVELTPEESRQFEDESTRIYRAMTGLDQPFEERARRAAAMASRAPLKRKTW